MKRSFPAGKDEEAASLGARPIPGVRGYFSTIDGTIYSAFRTWSGSPLRRLKTRVSKDGYLVCSIRLDAKTKAMRVHRLVALAFLPPPSSPDHIVRHKDDNPRNNHADNLAWGTHRDNKHDSMRSGRHTHGSKHARALLDESKVLDIRTRACAGEAYAALAAEYVVGVPTIRGIVKGKSWKHLPIMEASSCQRPQ
jgi:hypothetical protein